MRPEIERVRALIFDIGGTVFDWLSAVTDALAVLRPAHRPPDLDRVRHCRAGRLFDLYGCVYRRERGWVDCR